MQLFKSTLSYFIILMFSLLPLINLVSATSTRILKLQSVNDPVPAGCEATPITLNTEIKDMELSGFDAIDVFNARAKDFRAQTLVIANNGLKLIVTSCQAKDPEIGEYTHRECYTTLALSRTDDCRGAVIKEGKAAMLERIVKTIVDGTALILVGESLISDGKSVSERTVNDVKSNPMKLKSARTAAKNVENTTEELKNSILALKAAVEFAKGSKAALELWDLQ